MREWTMRLNQSGFSFWFFFRKKLNLSHFARHFRRGKWRKINLALFFPSAKLQSRWISWIWKFQKQIREEEKETNIAWWTLCSRSGDQKSILWSQLINKRKNVFETHEMLIDWKWNNVWVFCLLLEVYDDDSPVRQIRKPFEAVKHSRGISRCIET